MEIQCTHYSKGKGHNKEIYMNFDERFSMGNNFITPTTIITPCELSLNSKDKCRYHLGNIELVVTVDWKDVYVIDFERFASKCYDCSLSIVILNFEV